MILFCCIFVEKCNFSDFEFEFCLKIKMLELLLDLEVLKIENKCLCNEIFMFFFC